MSTGTGPDLNATRHLGTGGVPPDPARPRLAVLMVLRGAQVGRRYLLNENRLVLGRRPDRADLVIPDDHAVSSAHCRIERVEQPEIWTLVDLGSTNGTFVGGRRIATVELRDRDRIRLGDTILEFTFHDEIDDDFHRRLDRLMNLDDLTGLPVQRVFRDRFQDAIRTSTDTGVPLGVFMMDLDGLKRINDTHGHHLGAHSIAVAGRRLGALVDASGGVVSRFGGDEFSAFVPGLDRVATLALGERLRESIGDTPISWDATVVQPTISIGAAVCPDDGDSCEALMRRADEALYRAKAAGRNRVSV
ncbi:MAG: GGDEF domain-containing protein [Planctomycetes bacterium]|nr:GGDEF domain-containing protein [Planctomycetota bacterium]